MDVKKIKNLGKKLNPFFKPPDDYFCRYQPSTAAILK